MKRQLLTTAVCTLLVSAVNAAPIQVGYTYTWDITGIGSSSGSLAGVEFDADDLNNVLLNDGDVSPDGVNGWGGGELGIIGQNFEGSIIIDLGAVTELDSIVLLYNVNYGAGVVDPDQVDITIDGGTPIVFNSFPVDTPTQVSRVIEIDLVGNSGQIIKLDYTRGGEWTPFSEIDVYAVPEPSSLALIGMGGLLAFCRRRH